MASNITYWHEFPGNFSNGTSVDGIGTLIQYANHSVGGFLGMIILFGTFLISFFVLKGSNNTTRSLVASLFVTNMIAVLLMMLDMLSMAWVFTVALLLIIMSILSLVERNTSGL